MLDLFKGCVHCSWSMCIACIMGLCMKHIQCHESKGRICTFHHQYSGRNSNSMEQINFAMKTLHTFFFFPKLFFYRLITILSISNQPDTKASQIIKARAFAVNDPVLFQLLLQKFSLSTGTNFRHFTSIWSMPWWYFEKFQKNTLAVYFYY